MIINISYYNQIVEYSTDKIDILRNIENYYRLIQILVIGNYVQIFNSYSIFKTSHSKNHEENMNRYSFHMVG